MILLASQGISITEIAALVGVTRKTVGKWLASPRRVRAGSKPVPAHLCVRHFLIPEGATPPLALRAIHPEAIYALARSAKYCVLR
jgi:transposase